MGPGRRKSKCSNPRPQAEAEDNEYHRASERNTIYEEVTGRVKSSTDAEAGKTCADGTYSRESSAYDRALGAGEEEHGASIDRVCNNDIGGYHSTSIRSTHIKCCPGPRKRKGTCRQVP
jgi:hypothetical protein